MIYYILIILTLYHPVKFNRNFEQQISLLSSFNKTFWFYCSQEPPNKRNIFGNPLEMQHWYSTVPEHWLFPRVVTQPLLQPRGIFLGYRQPFPFLRKALENI
jgi:hypothetical protein